MTEQDFTMCIKRTNCKHSALDNKRRRNGFSQIQNKIDNFNNRCDDIIKAAYIFQLDFVDNF